MKNPFTTVSFLGLACSSPLLHAQTNGLFVPLGEGFYSNSVHCLLEDTINDQLIVGGGFTYSGVQQVSPDIVTWDGASFTNVGCGFDWDCFSQTAIGGSTRPVVTMTFWNGDLYAGGSMIQAEGILINGIARWDGTSWQPLLGGLDGPVRNLKAYPDGLYAAGWFDYADTVLANGVARWDGTQWNRVHNLPRFWSGGINQINDVAVYQGQVYIGGDFDDALGRNGIAYYNGSDWVGIGNGFEGSLNWVNTLEEHDGLLYVAGAFADYAPYGVPTNPGSGIVTWDGSTWDNLGGGTRDAYNPRVMDLVWLRDTLYVGGRYDRIGGVPAGRLARWDGQQWCALIPPDFFNGEAVALGQFRDTLYIGGSFSLAEQDTIKRIAKWIGGSYTDTCGFAVGITEQPNTTDLLLLWPNPVLYALHLNNPTLAQATITDATGRQVLTTTIPANGTLPVSTLASGSYILHLRSAQQHLLGTARFAKE